MNAASFVANIKEAAAIGKGGTTQCLVAKPEAKMSAKPYRKAPWAVRGIAQDVYQVGPWFVDVRHSVQGDKIKLRNGAEELRRYLTFAEASGMMGRGICSRCDAVYTKKMPKVGDTADSGEPFGWLCNMHIVRFPESHGGGCMIYSPVFGPDNTLTAVHAALAEHKLQPVRVIIAPTPQHHLALKAYQEAFPKAFYICGKASPQMPPLIKKRRDLRFDAMFSSGGDKGPPAVLGPAAIDGAASTTNLEIGNISDLLQSVFDVCVVDDNRTGEVTMLHRPSKTLLLSDLLYKSDPTIVGPGGGTNHYSTPDWFADGQQELFYAHPQDTSGGLLPSYRTHPRMRTTNIVGLKRSLDIILAWDFENALACHVDPVKGDEAKALLKTAWSYAWKQQEVPLI